MVKGLLKPFAGLINNVFNAEYKFYKRYEDHMKKYSNVKTEKVALLPFIYLGNRVVWKRSCYEGKDITLPFEMLSINVPSGYDRILKSCYGNWHEYSIGTTIHGGIIIDTEKPYTQVIEEYKRKKK